MRTIQTPINLNDHLQVELHDIFYKCVENGLQIHQMKSKHDSLIFELVQMSFHFHDKMEYFNDYSVAMTPNLSTDSYRAFEQQLRERKRAEARIISTIYYKLNLIRCKPSENLAEIAEALLLIAQHDFADPYKEYVSTIEKFISMFNLKK